MLRHLLLLLAAAGPSILMPVGVLAANQVAIVYDVQGSAEPEVFPFDELSAGTVINLPNEAVLNFVHYNLCKNITVKGGSLKIEEQKFTISGGAVLGQTDEQCPERVLLKNESTVIGSIKLRSVPKKTPQIGRAPTFITAAGNWPLGSKVSLLNANKKLVTNLVLRGRAASLPKGSSLLEADKEYNLKIQTEGKTFIRKFICKDKNSSVIIIGNKF